MTTGTAEAQAEARARAARAYSAANCMRIGAPRRAESVEPGGQLLGRHNTVQYLARCSVVVRRSFRFTFVTFSFFPEEDYRILPGVKPVYKTGPAQFMQLCENPCEVFYR